MIILHTFLDALEEQWEEDLFNMDALQRQLARMEWKSPSLSRKEACSGRMSTKDLIKRWITYSVKRISQDPVKYVDFTKEEKLFDIAPYAEITPHDLLVRIDSRWRKLHDEMSFPSYSSLRGIRLRVEGYDLSNSINLFDPDYTYRVMINSSLGKDDDKWFFVCFDINRRKGKFFEPDQLEQQVRVKTATEAGYPISFEINNTILECVEMPHHPCDLGSYSHHIMARKAKEIWNRIYKDLEIKLPGFLEYYFHAPLGTRTITHAALKKRNHNSLDQYFEAKTRGES